ncbi:MAG: hypothetical protein ACR2NM_00100 [Bythopirellula sp.]
MHLEARSPSCFSTEYLLKLDDRPVGRFRGRWFSEGIDVRLTERLQLHFEKDSWLGSNFRLIDAHSEEILASGSRSGFFTRSWDLALKSGPAQLVASGLFSTGYEVRLQDRMAARATRIDWCSGGWQVVSDATLDATDVVFVGLVYHTILKRQRNNNNST